jgi:hypothetical protein
VTQPIGSTTVTTHYRFFGARDAYLCDICAVRYLVIRFFAPMLSCIGLELGASYGFDPLGFQLAAGGVAPVLMAAFVLQVYGVTAVTVTAGWQRPGSEHGAAGCLNMAAALGAIGGGLVSVIGGLMAIALAMALSGGEHSLLAETDPDVSAFNGWFVGVLIGFQLVIYLNVWAGRRLLLKNKAWRCRKQALRIELDEPDLVALNTARYRALSGHENAPVSQGRPGHRSVDHFENTRICIDVPSWDSTRIFTPVPGSFTPAVGCSAYQYFLVSSNSGCASLPRT